MNIPNGLQDTGIGLLNLGLHQIYGLDGIESMTGLDLSIPSPDWSKGLITGESDFAHDFSKFAGAASVEAATGAWFAKAARARAAAEAAANAANAMRNAASRCPSPGSISGNPANRLVETGIPKKGGAGWQRRWTRMTAEDELKQAEAFQQRYDEALKQANNLSPDQRSNYIFENMKQFRTEYRQRFLSERTY